jgi:hypothetical protein
LIIFPEFRLRSTPGFIPARPAGAGEMKGIGKRSRSDFSQQRRKARGIKARGEA